jgi:hypothetical protein
MPEATQASSAGAPPENGRPENNLEGKAARMSGHARGLMGELTQWVDLKIQHAVAEVRAEVEAKGRRLAKDVAAGILAASGVLFVLIALALAIGAWLGPIWGFAIVAMLLLGAAYVLFRTNRPKPRGRDIPVVARRPASALPPITPKELPDEIRSHHD